MNAELVQNGVTNEKLVNNFVIRRLRWICPFKKFVDGTVCNQKLLEEVLMRMNRGC